MFPTVSYGCCIGCLSQSLQSQGVATRLSLSPIWLLAVSHCLSGLMELLHVSHCILCLLAVTHSPSGPLELLAVSHSLP